MVERTALEGTALDGPAPDGPALIDANEAAARLGVKKSTLYAYVSRGQLTRQRAVDGKHSMFDPDEIDAFSKGRRRDRQGEVSAAIASGITRVEPGAFGFRDRPIADYLDQPFERVAEAIWRVDPQPWSIEPEIQSRCVASQAVFPNDALAIDRLRTAVSIAASCDPLRFDLDRLAVAAAGQQLIGAMIESLPERAATGSPGQVAGRLWGRLGAKASTKAQESALNTALVVLADHGLAASTFAGRVAASVRADPYSVVAAGLGALGGRLHGAASSDVHRLFERAEQLDSGTRAVGEILRRGDRVPGFGHTVYRSGDPRFPVLFDQALATTRSTRRVALITEIHDAVTNRAPVLPNIDFALGTLTYLSGMPDGSGEAIFAVSRSVGWLAHALEEYDEAPLRFRPQARYVRASQLAE